MIKDRGQTLLEHDVETLLLEVKRLRFNDLHARESGDRKADLRSYLEGLITRVDSGSYANDGQK